MTNNLSEELQKAQEELRKLDSKYIGSTPAQQQTLEKLKQMNPIYAHEKKVLDAKITYLKASIEKSNFESLIDKIKREDSFRDAIFDSI